MIETRTNEYTCLRCGRDPKFLSVDFHDPLLWLGQQRGCQTQARRRTTKGRNRSVPGNVNQISADGWSKSTEASLWPGYRPEQNLLVRTFSGMISVRKTTMAPL